MVDTTVKYFDSTMVGAPSISGTAGALINVLNACLVNGFGTVTLNSLSVAANVATATVSAGHNFPMIGATGPVIRIEGATPSALNSEWRIASVPNSTTFTFQTTGIADQTATGTITAKRTPAGWQLAFTGTNLAAYTADNVQATNLYFRVDDTTTTYASVLCYETMTDVNTGTGAFGSYGTSGRVYKSDVASASVRGWRLFSDHRCFYLFINKGAFQSNYYIGSTWFGDIVESIPDSYGCGIIATDTNNYDWGVALLANSTFSQMARSYTQLGGTVTFNRTSARMVDTSMGFSGQTYPSPVGSYFHCFPVLVLEGSNYRGDMPGLYGPAHNLKVSSNDGAVLSPVQINDEARDFMIVAVRENANGYRVIIDITGPWR